MRVRIKVTINTQFFFFNAVVKTEFEKKIKKIEKFINFIETFN